MPAASQSRTRPTLTVPQAADTLGLPKRTVYEWCRKGTFPHIRLGRRVLILRETVDRLLAQAQASSASNALLRRLGGELPW